VVSENEFAASLFWGYVHCRGPVLWSTFIQEGCLTPFVQVSYPATLRGFSMTGVAAH